MNGEVKEHPIIFSTPMVQAILTGKKTMTRRRFKQDPQLSWHADKIVSFRADEEGRAFPKFTTGREGMAYEVCPYGQVGDKLWVREKWAQPSYGDLKNESLRGRVRDIEYAADMGIERFPFGGNFIPQLADFTWRSPIHLPRISSRITLEITGIRVQRLQEISEEDAKQEGAMFHDGRGIGHSGWRHDECAPVWGTARESFIAIWDSIYGLGCWHKNGWVWALTFKVLEIKGRAEE
jgi:hypothetical protein